MCFAKTPKMDPIAATPTATNIGADEATTANKEKDRAKQRAAAGYQQNILSGATGTSDANVSKKSILG